MIPTVVVVLTVLSSTLTLPITTQDGVTTSIEGEPQIQGGVPLPQQVQKTGVQGYFDANAQTQKNQIVKSTVHSGTPEQYANVNSVQGITQTEKSGEISTNAFASPQNAAVPKVESVPVNDAHAQSSYTENPVFLPIQPLSVVPSNQAGQVLQPVRVPVETIPAERMIIMTIDSFQQRNFPQDVSNVPESQITYQQVVQPATCAQVPTQGVEPNQQKNSFSPVEKQNQGYSSVRAQSNLIPHVREQTLPVTQTAQQSVTPNSNQTPFGPSAQVYSAQLNEQPAITEDIKKQAFTGYGPVQTQFVEPSVQQQQQFYVQQLVEKQMPYQQSSIQSQSNFLKPTGFENVVKQVPNQQYNDAQTQSVEQNYQQQQDYNTQQAVKKQVPYQQVNNYTPVQNQPADQSFYNAQPVAVEKTEKAGQYQQDYSPVQTQSVESQQQQTQNAQQITEKQLPYQQPVAVQTYSVEPVNQQQPLSVQPLNVGQVKNQDQYQKESQSQNVEYFLEKAPENSTFGPNQQIFNVQPQEDAHYGEYTYSFGDKISQVQQNAPVHTLTSVPQTQDYSVQPSVNSA